MDGNFSWDDEWFKKTGKWRLIDNEQKQPHVCVKAKSEKKQKRIEWCYYSLFYGTKLCGVDE